MPKTIILEPEVEAGSLLSENRLLSEKIESIDRSRMLSLLEDFPRQFTGDLDLSPVSTRPAPVSGIVFCGMGGSAMAGDLASEMLGERLSLPLETVRDYNLPKWVDKKTMVIFLSYSGNTEETLSAARECLEKEVPCAIVTSGGKLGEIAREKKIPLAAIPAGNPPRTALGSLFRGISLILDRTGALAEDAALLKSLFEASRKAVEECRPESSWDENPARRLAAALRGVVPVLYSCRSLTPVAFRWKTQIAENSKALSFHGQLPEMNHNEVVGWSFPESLVAGFAPVFLRDRSENPRVSRRVEITGQILEPRKFSCCVSSAGDTAAERMISLLAFGDWVSYYLALENSVDPTPVERISYLKEKLSETPA